MSIDEMLHYCRTRIGVENCYFTPEPYRDGLARLTPPDYYLQVPCGHCSECRKRHRLGWSLRLMQEMQLYKESTFLTLTLTNENWEKYKDDEKRPLMLYIDRLRKALGYRPRYWFTSELGEDDEHTHRLHYHGILFDTSRRKLPFDLQRGKWTYGHCWLGYCNFKTANYIVKYLLKGTKDYKPFILCSNGIGESYVTFNRIGWHVNNCDFRDYVMFNNRRYPLPVYYQNKIYNDDLKLCKMINRYRNPEQPMYIYKGIQYPFEIQYRRALDAQYKWTLTNGLSLPLKTKSNGFIYISESGH